MDNKNKNKERITEILLFYIRVSIREGETLFMHKYLGVDLNTIRPLAVCIKFEYW
jgi:hypothetical protein